MWEIDSRKKKKKSKKRKPDGTFKLSTNVTNLQKKTLTFAMWYSNDMFLNMFKDEIVTLLNLKIPSGRRKQEATYREDRTFCSVAGSSSLGR